MSECALSENAIREVLNSIGDPCSAAHGLAMGIGDMGLIEWASIGPDGQVDVRIRLTSPCCSMVGYFIDEARSRLRRLDGVTAVEVAVDQGLDWRPEMMSSRAQDRRNAKLVALGLPMMRASF